MFWQIVAWDLRAGAKIAVALFQILSEEYPIIGICIFILFSNVIMGVPGSWFEQDATLLISFTVGSTSMFLWARVALPSGGPGVHTRGKAVSGEQELANICIHHLHAG